MFAELYLQFEIHILTFIGLIQVLKAYALGTIKPKHKVVAKIVEYGTVIDVKYYINLKD